MGNALRANPSYGTWGVVGPQPQAGINKSLFGSFSVFVVLLQFVPIASCRAHSM
jgi:hypothetical protein